MDQRSAYSIDHGFGHVTCSSNGSDDSVFDRVENSFSRFHHPLLSLRLIEKKT
jgi:hypothetical protein